MEQVQCKEYNFDILLKPSYFLEPNMGLDFSNMNLSLTPVFPDYIRQQMKNRVVFLSLANNNFDRVPHTLLSFISDSLQFLTLAGNSFSSSGTLKIIRYI